MFRTAPCPSPGVFHCTHHNGICHTGMLCVQCKTPDDGQRNRPKHVEFHSKIKNFEKLVHLVGSIVRNLFSYIIMLKCNSKTKTGKVYPLTGAPYVTFNRLQNITLLKLHYFRYMAVFCFTFCTVHEWRVESSGMWHIQFNR